MNPPSSTLDAPSDTAAEEAAAALATADTPPRPEGAADDDGFYDPERDTIDPAKLADAAGITRDQEEARAAKAGQQQELAGMPDAVTDYDREVWAEIIGGAQPSEVKIAVKGLPSLTLEGIDPSELKKGAVFELRVRAQVTGYGANDGLRHNLESEELEISKTVEKRTLTITAAAVCDD